MGGSGEGGLFVPSGNMQSSLGFSDASAVKGRYGDD